MDVVGCDAAQACASAPAHPRFHDEPPEYDVLTSVVHPRGMHTALHGFRHPWMHAPEVVAETAVAQLQLPRNVVLLSFDIDVEHPDAI